jgi:hypothetical protein
MNNVSQYYGVVTLELLTKNKRNLLSRQLNEGTVNLFSAYAAALTGQNISNLIPSTIDIGKIETIEGKLNLNSFESVLNSSGALASVVYVSDTNDESYKNYGVPYTRVTASFTSLMIGNNINNENNYLVLKSYSNKILATIQVNEEISSILNQLTSGSQFIIIWDLYVTNKTT